MSSSENIPSSAITQRKAILKDFGISKLNERLLTKFMTNLSAELQSFVDTETVWIKYKNIQGEDKYSLIMIALMKDGEPARMGGKYQVLELGSQLEDPNKKDSSDNILEDFKDRVITAIE